VACFRLLFPLVGVTLRAPAGCCPGGVVALAGLNADDEEGEAEGLAGCSPAADAASGALTSGDWPRAESGFSTVPRVEDLGKLEVAVSGTCRGYEHDKKIINEYRKNIKM